MGGLFGGSKNTVIDNGSVASFQINSATYGIVVPIILGTSRQSGNVIDYYDFTKITHKETQRTGKGGGSKTTTVTYSYKAAVLIALCEGQIDGIGKVWVDTDTITNLAATGLTLFDGAIGQPIWSYTLSKNPAHALPYSGLAYVAGFIDLNSSAGMQNYNFEIKGQLRDTGDGVDINPVDANTYILTNKNNGLGFTLENIHLASQERFKTFCRASDLFITVPLTDQSKAYEIINTNCEMTNTIVFWSQRKIKYVPRCEDVITGNGVTYTPNTTPEYDLTTEDFLEDEDGKLVTWERTDNAETYNQVTVEFTNRANGYETETVDYQILADINDRGLRPMPTVSYPYIHTKARAEQVAQQIAMDSCYGRNAYNFKLGLAHSLLEPGDIVTLTELKAAGLNKLPVMIEDVTEDGEEAYSLKAKYKPKGIYSPARYSTYDAERAFIDYNVDPGNVNQPVIFELPYILTDGDMQIVLAVAGDHPFWGGCGVWISSDGITYVRAGEVNIPARYGVVAETLKAGGTTDTINTLKVDMSRSHRQLASGTKEDAKTYQTLCYVDGELIAYETAALTDTDKYDLSYLVRGCYGSEIKAHAKNSPFVRLDKDILFSYGYLPQDIGKTVYIKLTSINSFGIREQNLEDVEPYTYVIQGKIPESGVEFTVTQSGEKLVASLKNTYSNSDYLAFFTYELRMGATWDKAVLINRFSGDTYTFDAPGEGTLTFWLKVVDQVGNYSKTATRAIVNVINLPVRNIIFDREEDTDLWIVTNMWRDEQNRYRIKSIMTLGEYNTFADMFGNDIYLRSDAEILMPPIDLGPNILDESCYWIDNAGNVRLKSVETLADFNPFSDIFGAKLTPMKPSFTKETFVGVDVKHTIRGNARIDIEYRTSMNGEQWSNWIPNSIKQFSGRYVQIRLLPISVDGLGQVYISGATVSIDVPDIEEIIENVAIPASRTRLTYKRKFAEVKSVSLYTQDLSGKQATCYIADQTNEYVDLEILDQNGTLIPGKLQMATIRGY